MALTMNTSIKGMIVLLTLLFSLYHIISYKAVSEERQAVAEQQAKANRELQDKYDGVHKQYKVLRAKKDAVRQTTTLREDKLIDENKDYYAGECFDANSLQHIQSAQSGN